ncbi:MAG TPA: beta-N-acetylhexosaminidase [Bacilli bacterium]
MNLNLVLSDESEDLEQGILEISNDLHIEWNKDGLSVIVERTGHGIEVECSGKGGRIACSSKIHFYRALGLFVEAHRESNPFKINELPQFSSVGAMFDLSRNAVLKLDSMKQMIRHMALMGMDRLLLYMEDTYEIPGRPYFGYFRGRYSHADMKQMDDYADLFGIEVVPVIQTLGHLQQALKWNTNPEIHDTGDILMAGHPETYEFIEQMIKHASAPFRSKRIHLGMDEAEQAGLGHYLKLNGYRDRFDIMTAHLNTVIEIASAYGLEPMIWSDMYFKFASKHGEYYDLETQLPGDVQANMPKNVNYVYWDYYHDTAEHYRSMIQKHQGLGLRKVFAGGIWTFVGININYDKTFITTNAAMQACKEEGVEEVFATLWGDNGTETDYFTGLPGLQLYAEHAYASTVHMDKVKKRFQVCTGASYDSFMDLSLMDQIPGVRHPNVIPSNPSKMLLWQDILAGLFDKHTEGLDIAEYYRNLKVVMEMNGSADERWEFIFEMPGKLCDVLSLKADLGVKLKHCYDSLDKDGLSQIANDLLPELYLRVESLRLAHRKQWYRSYRPLGWEVLDVRYGGLLARIHTAIWRISEFINGRVAAIEELEEERLYFFPNYKEENRFAVVNSYARIFSGSMHP